MLFFQQVVCRNPHDEKSGEKKTGRKHVENLKNAVIVKNNRKKIGKFSSPVSDGIAHRVLHETVCRQNPDAREITGCGNNPHHPCMGYGRQLFPAENPDADECGFKKESNRCFNG